MGVRLSSFFFVFGRASGVLPPPLTGCVALCVPAVCLCATIYSVLVRVGFAGAPSPEKYAG